MSQRNKNQSIEQHSGFNKSRDHQAAELYSADNKVLQKQKKDVNFGSGQQFFPVVEKPSVLNPKLPPINLLNKNASTITGTTEAQTLRDAELRAEAVQDLNTLGDFRETDPDDDYWGMVQKYVEAPGAGAQAYMGQIVPGVGQALVPQEYWNWQERKQAQLAEESYKQFKMQQVDLRTPESRAYWEKKEPELVDELRKGYEKQLAIKIRMAHLTLYGVQNESDMFFLYQNELGLRDLYGPSASYPISDQNQNSLFQKFKGYWIDGLKNGWWTGANKMPNANLRLIKNENVPMKD